MAELLHVAGLVASTVLACTWYEDVSLRVAPWVRRIRPETVAYAGFLILFALALLVIVHVGIRLLVKRVMWERLTWPVQGLGLLFGGVRGLWWSGLLLWLVVATGEPYLTRSIQERSLFSPRLMQVSQEALRGAVQWTSGPIAGDRRLMPSLVMRRP